MAYRANCFGGLVLRDPKNRLLQVSGRRGDALLARLIWDQGDPVPRHALIALLWPEREGTGATALRQAVHLLRGVLGQSAIVTAHGYVMLSAEALQTDLAQLRDPETAMAAAEQMAATLTRGRFLSGLRAAGPEHAAWLEDVRARADGLAADTLLSNAQAAFEAGRIQAAIGAAEAALCLAPQSEAALQVLMDTSQDGTSAAAAAALERFQRQNGPVPLRQSMASAQMEDAATHPVIALGVILRDPSEPASARLAQRLREAGAEDVQVRQDTLTAFVGRKGLRRSRVVEALALAETLARDPSRPAVGIALARLPHGDGPKRLREVDRARTLTQADAVGPGRVGRDLDLERLSGAEIGHAPTSQVAAFVGRRAEQMQIETLWESMASDGRTRLLTISGPPGIGKSRLLTEVTSGLPRHAFAVVPSALLSTDRTDLMSRLQTALPRAPSDRPAQTVVRDFLVMRTQPMMIAVEDAETMSRFEAGGLAALVMANCQAPLLWITLARSDSPGRLPLLERLAGAVPIMELFLGPLSVTEAQTVSEQFDLSEEDRRMCLEQANGNPLFLNQLLLHMAQGADVACPASVEEAVTARLASLDVQATICLRLTAILGDLVPETTVRELAAASADVIDQLVDRRLLRREGGMLASEHGLIRSAILNMTPEHQQSSIHRRAAQWYRDRDLSRHAWHLLSAGDEAASAALLQAARANRHAGRAAVARDMAVAGQKATRRKALRAALAVEQGFALTQDGVLVDAERAFRDAMSLTLDRGVRADALIGLANVHRLRDDAKDGLEALAQADPLLATAEQTARHLIAKGRLLYVSGAWQDSVTQNKAARDQAQSAARQDLEAQALGGLADAAYATGDMASAETHVRAAIEAARKAGNESQVPTQNALLAHVLIYRGCLSEGRSLAIRTVNAARNVSDWRAEINAQLGIASAAFCMNDLDQCAAATDRVGEIAQRTGADRFRFVAGLYEARIALTKGDTVAAAEVLDCLDALQDMRQGPIHAPQYWLLRALTHGRSQGLKSDLMQAEALLGLGAAAHNALRVLPVAALLWHWLKDQTRRDTSLLALKRFSATGGSTWAATMQAAISAQGEAHCERHAALAQAQRFVRLAAALRADEPDQAALLVC
ncbi:MAG: AAA family ATPase [Pseudomonadota bacterium]